MSESRREGSLGSPYSKALVTGGAGFIGSHIVDRLLEDGLEVVVIDNLSTGTLENVGTHPKERSFQFIKGDIRDCETLKKALRDVQVVFHEAALVGDAQSSGSALLINEVNVTGTLNLLTLSSRLDVDRVVLASSAAVYGEQASLPVKENAALHPISLYAVSKLAAERYTEAYGKAFGLETVSLRYFNVYGERQRIGPYSAVITAFLDHLMKSKSPTIYGDGEQTRDFVSVKDVVEANMLAMEKKGARGVFNVATGSQLTINELFATLRDLVGDTVDQLEPTYSGARPSDIRYSRGDCSRAKEVLGFEPKILPKIGLRDLVEASRKTCSRRQGAVSKAY